MDRNEPYHISIKDNFESEKREIGCHYILYIDLLGTSKKSLIELDEYIHFLYSKLNSTIELLKMLHDESYSFSAIKKVLVFQDSVFVVFDNEKIDNLTEILLSVMAIFAMCFVNQIPIRGGLAHGEIIMYENSIFGKPINCLINNEKFNMLGICIDSSIHEYQQDILKRKYPIPVITSLNGKKYLDWLFGLCIYFPSGELKFDSIADYFEYQLTKFKIPDRAKEKYKNTKQFFYSALNAYPEYNQLFLNNQSKFMKQ